MSADSSNNYKIVKKNRLRKMYVLGNQPFTPKSKLNQNPKNCLIHKHGFLSLPRSKWHALWPEVSRPQGSRLQPVAQRPTHRQTLQLIDWIGQQQNKIFLNLLLQISFTQSCKYSLNNYNHVNMIWLSSKTF